MCIRSLHRRSLCLFARFIVGYVFSSNVGEANKELINILKLRPRNLCTVPSLDDVVCLIVFMLIFMPQWAPSGMKTTKDYLLLCSLFFGPLLVFSSQTAALQNAVCQNSAMNPCSLLLGHHSRTSWPLKGADGNLLGSQRAIVPLFGSFSWGFVLHHYPIQSSPSCELFLNFSWFSDHSIHIHSLLPQITFWSLYRPKPKIACFIIIPQGG